MNTHTRIIFSGLWFALGYLLSEESIAQFVQQGPKLVGTGTAGAAVQGFSVSLSADGNTAIVGGYGDGGTVGAAWVYTRSGGVWTQQGNKLVGTGAVGAEVRQGCSVSLSADGNTAILGGFGDGTFAGAAWVFTRSGGVWTQQGGKLVGTGAAGSIVYQGYSVSLSGDGNTAIVGADDDNNSVGAGWVYTRSGGIWTQQGSKLVGTGAVGISKQGYSIALAADGNTAIVGGFGDSSSAGAAWVYARLTGSIRAVYSTAWNLISVPLRVLDYQRTSLYPAAISRAFVFQGSYQRRDTLENGAGYWLKFGSNDTIQYVGTSIARETISVKNGWNMIGSISTAIPVSGIASIPPGIATSPFFRYSGSYTISDSIQPGRAYWVRVNLDGELILSSTGASSASSRIRIIAEADLPPSPPGQQSVHERRGLPSDFVLEQNFPNPFNPATAIKYELPTTEHVRLSVFNVLGEEVAELVNERQEAGYKSFSFNAGTLPSGIYTYHLSAGSFSQTKKMVLMR